jgi:multiple antibiotic resistance protein
MEPASAPVALTTGAGNQNRDQQPMTSSFILANALYFLALINPASKVFLLSSADPPYAWPELRSIAVRSTLAAFVILATLACAGSYILDAVFQVQLYSLKVAGGVILFLIGLNAVRKGVFHESTDKRGVGDISIVPMAAPLIAGPGTITGAISFNAIHGSMATILCMAIALAVNLAFMLLSMQIGRLLEKIHATGPLIRITGLIVAAVSVQMIFAGCEMWLKSIH